MSLIHSQLISYMHTVDTTGFPITSTILRDDVLQLPNPTDE